MNTTGAWIGVDLDCTLAHYDGWKGIAHIGAPIPAMIQRVQLWLIEGRRVKIFTARVAPPNDPEVGAQIVQDWLESCGLPRLEVTATKDLAMMELWDDRCVQVQKNTGQLITDLLRR